MVGYIDQSLYFANIKFLEDAVLGLVADRPEVKDFVPICTAINFIDASAIETLESLVEQLKDAGVQFHLAAVKGPVLDQLKQSDLWPIWGRIKSTLRRMMHLSHWPMYHQTDRNL